MAKKEYMFSGKIEREIKLGQKTRVGKDTNLLIDFIEVMQTKLHFININQPIDDKMFFTHEFCIREARRVLTRDKGYNEEEAEEAIQQLLDFFKIGVIKFSKNQEEEGERILKLCKDLGLHHPDNFIIAGFKEYKMSVVYSQNNHFVDSCNRIGLKARKFPTSEKILDLAVKGKF